MTKKAHGITFGMGRPGVLQSIIKNDGSFEALSRKYDDEERSKLMFLCQGYGIQHGPSMFYELALRLARELFPEPKKRGRKSKWTTLNKGALVVEIERLHKPGDPSHGIEWACSQIAKREPWKSFLEIKESAITSPDPAEALRKVYYDFRADRWAAVMRDVFKLYEMEGNVAEWEPLVMDYVRNPHPK